MGDKRRAIAAIVGSQAPENTTTSALGGPAWRPDDSVTWPKDRRGIVMMHLARINFAETPPLKSFPTSGLLQVFISTEVGMLGVDDPHGEGFQIEYWHYPENGIAVPQPFLDEDNFEATPLCAGTLEDNMHDHGRTLSFDGFQMAADDAPENRPEVWLGGWPFSVQDMENDPDEIVLLQIGNGESGDHVAEFMFGGDIGTATFTISPKALSKKRFDLTAYDCAGY